MLVESAIFFNNRFEPHRFDNLFTEEERKLAAYFVCAVTVVFGVSSSRCRGLWSLTVALHGHTH